MCCRWYVLADWDWFHHFDVSRFSFSFRRSDQPLTFLSLSALYSALPGAITTKPGCASLPFFGIEPVLLDPTTGTLIEGNGKEGVLAIARPWPSIARTVYNDHTRFLETYMNVSQSVFYSYCFRDWPDFRCPLSALPRILLHWWWSWTRFRWLLWVDFFCVIWVSKIITDSREISKNDRLDSRTCWRCYQRFRTSSLDCWDWVCSDSTSWSCWDCCCRCTSISTPPSPVSRFLLLICCWAGRYRFPMSWLDKRLLLM